jgi:hypothetical protein
MIGSILVLLALILVPGVGAALAFTEPGALALESRFTLAFGFGYAVVAGLATLLALAHVLSRASFIAALVLATITLWALAVRQSSLRAQMGAIAAEAHATPYALGAGLVLVVAVAACRPFYRPELTLGIRSAWRYWADGLEVASAGHFPATTHQWGIEFPATVSKAVLNAFEGGTSLLLGADPLGPMQGILAVAAIGVVAALFAVGREFGLGVFAPVFPLFVILMPQRAPLPVGLAGVEAYSAENVGRFAAFSALLVGIHALRSRSPRMPVVAAGLMFAVAGLTHLIPTLVAAIMLVCFGVATALVRHERVIVALARVVAMLAVFAVFYVATIGLSGGDLGWQTAGGQAFTGFPANVDPAASFTEGRLVKKIPKEGHFLVAPKRLVGLLGATVVNRPDRVKAGLALLAVLGLAALGLALLVRSLLPAVAVAWGLVAAMLAIALYFSFRYSTTVPGRFGPGRMYDYVAVSVALFVGVILEALFVILGQGRKAALAAVAVALGIVAVVAAVARIPSTKALPRAQAGLEAIDQVARVVPCGTRMLVNARTAGTWEATTGRLAVTEGHAPYLRPDVIDRVVPVIVGANEFFQNPSGHRDYLERERVQYVVTIDPHVLIGSKGPRQPRAEDSAAVAALPNVGQILSDPHVSVFAVDGAARPGAGETPDRCPLEAG